MVLKTKEFYPTLEDHQQFEARLQEFLKIDTNSEIIDYNDGVLSYLTLCSRVFSDYYERGLRDRPE